MFFLISKKSVYIDLCSYEISQQKLHAFKNIKPMSSVKEQPTLKNIYYIKLSAQTFFLFKLEKNIFWFSNQQILYQDSHLLNCRHPVLLTEYYQCQVFIKVHGVLSSTSGNQVNYGGELQEQGGREYGITKSKQMKYNNYFKNWVCFLTTLVICFKYNGHYIQESIFLNCNDQKELDHFNYFLFQVCFFQSVRNLYIQICVVMKFHNKNCMHSKILSQCHQLRNSQHLKIFIILNLVPKLSFCSNQKKISFGFQINKFYIKILVSYLRTILTQNNATFLNQKTHYLYLILQQIQNIPLTTMTSRS
eukprot:TRINITY_DN3915_c2_g1_i1.p1 TRINITY_DN3915_c2_g1~~TRINITY_DN3915_c2_g1_i1.p1  ORF type:complete len:305 (-),score=-35.72 TRINITY_DN3915_c2_g1_i1:102-1016(-)